MTGAFYLILFILVAFILGLVAYYAWRLFRVGRAPDDSATRFQAFLRQTGGPAGSPPRSLDAGANFPRDPNAGGGLGVRGSGNPRWGSTAEDGSRVYERRVGLGRLSSAPVFIKRDPSGEVYFQLEDRPPAPLKYLLEPVGRKILQDVVGQVSIEFGPSWAILASEDDEGRLVVTRLT
ncbi:MAG: hypothetical protein M5U22_12595 [Thermoleophilia bacterium]|nr:hypothetical protein [Thermoleophilia bacterium]